MKKPNYSGHDFLSSTGDPLSIYGLKQAYQKHVMNDDSIGWDELADTLANCLATIMGDDEFCEWTESVKK